MGFMDGLGNVVIEPHFHQNRSVMGRYFSDAGYAIVVRHGERQKIVIDESGETVLEIPEEYQVGPFTRPDENGIFQATRLIDGDNAALWELVGRDIIFTGETRYYAMRLDGSVAFRAYFTSSCHGRYVFHEGSQWKGKKGLLDQHGEIILPAIYDHISLSPTDPFATVVREGWVNVVTLEGTPVFKQEFEVQGEGIQSAVQDGFWIVRNAAKDRADVYDIASAEVIGTLPLTYWSPSIPKACPSLSGGVASITHPRKGTAYYRPNGKPAMPEILGRPRWFSPEMRTGYFHDGRASFKLGDLWGYLDLSGKHAIAPQFGSDLPFRDGLAKVRYPADGNAWHRFSYVDRDGAVVWHQEE